MSSLPQLLRNIVANYTGSAVSVVVLFFLTPFVIRSLGNEAYAVWVLVHSVAFYLYFFDLGAYDALVKYTAECDPDNPADKGELERLVGTGMVLFGLAGLAAFVASLGFAHWLVPHLGVSPELLPTVQLVTLILGVDAAFHFVLAALVGLLEGQQRYDVLNAVNIARRAIQAVATVALLGLGFGLVALAVLELLLSVIALGAVAAIVSWLHPELSLTFMRFDGATWRRMRGYSLWALANEIASEGSSELDKLFIPAFLSIGLLTPYAVACSIGAVVLYLIEPIVKVFFPFSSRLGAADDREGLDQLLIRGSKATLAISLPVGVLLLFTGDAVISNWVGPEYAPEAAPVLRIVLTSFLVSAAFAPSVKILAALAKVREIFLLTVTEVCLAASLVALTARAGGLPALAASLLAANCAINFGLLLPLTCRTLGVPVTRYLREVIAAPLGPALLAAGAAGLLLQYFRVESWLDIAATGALISVVYTSAFLAMCVSKREREEIYHYASRLFAAGAAGAR
jgi:O-antigen/teichoic acid export membrane protein